MKNNRFNIFNQIHKGLRALLYHTALTIQQTDFTEVESAEETVKAVEDVMHLFEDHAHNEDTFILPAVGHFDASIKTAFESEHVEDDRLAKEILAATNAWKNATQPADTHKAGETIFYHFNAFVAFNLYHMNKEETILNNALWQYFTDAEIVGILSALLAKVPQKIMEIESVWMMRGLNNMEVTMWLQEIKNNAPLHVFKIFTDLAENELTTERWNNINASLADAVMCN